MLLIPIRTAGGAILSIDEEHLRKAREVTQNVQDLLARARSNTVAARSGFAATKMTWWGTIGDKLRGNRPYAAHYKELQAALGDAEAALNRAESACAALSHAVNE
jgi:hypothetical protein